jgi:hypothetical protein
MKSPLVDPSIKTNWNWGMSDKEIVEYYHKHIEPQTKWKEENGKLFYEVKDDENIKFAEYAGSDLFFVLRPAVFDHIKKANERK